MKFKLKRILLILLLLAFTRSFPQSTTEKVKRFGFMGSFDYEYGFKDKILNPGLTRRWTFGASFSNKKKEFVVFVAAGIKGAKLNIYSPSLRQSCLNDVRQNYSPINGYTEDSLIGARINTTNGKDLWGTYAQFLEAGFILNKKIAPTFTFYYGSEQYLLYDRAFTQFEDPKYGDIHYVEMNTVYYEFRLGFGIPLKFETSTSVINVSIGYKWVDYGNFEFNKTPLSSYTTENLINKYHNAGKITLSVSVIMWSNW